MQIALRLKEDAKRLAALKEYNILDTAPEKDFDELVALASAICETPISTITLIDENRQWHKARIGLADQEGNRDHAFCAHAINEDDLMVVPDATKDDRFFDNPFVTGNPDIRFYAGMPLVNPEGFKLGTLCVIDRKPKNLSESQLLSLRVLGKQVMKQMELRRKLSELQRLNDINHKLLSVISHDLRSPFSSLYGLLEMVERYDLPPEEFKNMIPGVKKGFNAANGLLTNLLEWATSQFDQHEIVRHAFSLKQLADAVIESNTQLFQQKGNTVLNTIDVGVKAWSDENMIKAVFRNLIINANKFTKGGTITLAAEEVGNMIVVCISDTGIGITNEHREKMFSWGHRSSTIGTGGERGSGFGLLVCKEFVERNGGQMWFTSEPGKGSQFYFSLPKS
ncbi:MAG TPA: GAF domain-containing sensor histidine kinase [Cyclobacteriaceae bacterium]